MAEYLKVLPDIENEDVKPFWDALKSHKFCLQKCAICGHVRFPVSPNCTDCLSDQWEWAEMSGKGKVWSFVEFYQRYHRGWEDELPYNVAYVLIDEGLGLITNLVNVAREDIQIDMPVEVYFDDVTENVTLLKFKPVKQ